MKGWKHILALKIHWQMTLQRGQVSFHLSGNLLNLSAGGSGFQFVGEGGPGAEGRGAGQGAQQQRQ